MGSRAGIVALVVLSIVVQPVGAVASSGHAIPTGESAPPAPVETVNQDASTDGAIVRTMTVSLTPTEPGSVDVRVRYSIPDNVVDLETTVPANATVRTTRGFSNSAGNYSWDGRTTDPSITFSLPANRTGTYRYEPNSRGYLFVDTGDWALVSVPPLSTRWTYVGSPTPHLVRRVRTDGEGVAGTRIVYLGPHRETTRSVCDHRVTLVVPEAADLEPSREDLFSSLEAAAETLRVGNAPPQILIVAAPTSVDWGPNGLTDRPDAWVRADQSLETPSNVWLHEYVHLRQDFTTTTDARWTIEAMGEYYAAYLSLKQGLVGFEAFQRHLADGADEKYDGSVLTEPGTWAPLADYIKGGLVFGNLDRRMRLATDGRNPASDLFRAMNRKDGPVSHGFLRRRVESLAGAETARYFDRYASTDRRPTMWTREEHTAAFSTLPPRIVTGISSEYSIEGPYRNRSVRTIPVLVTGETLAIDVTVTNEGDATGEYHVTFHRNGTRIETLEGSLDGGDTVNRTFRTRFDEPGTYDLEIDGWNRTISVRSPSKPTVTDIQLPEGPVGVGESFEVRVTVANPADRPADDEMRLSVDGTPIDSWRTRLDVGQRQTRTFEISGLEAGEHEITVGDSRQSISVGHETSTRESPTTATSPTAGTTRTTSAHETTRTTVPGFHGEIVIAFLMFSLLIAMLRPGR